MKKDEIIGILLVILMVVGVIFGYPKFSRWLGSGHSNEIAAFSLSPDDATIVFDYEHNKRESIYLLDTTGNDLREIVPGTADTNFHFPSFSADGKKVLFVGSPTDDVDGASTIYVANADGMGKKALFKAEYEITEILYSKCSDKIIFVERTGLNSCIISELPPGGRPRMLLESSNLISGLGEFNCDELIFSNPTMLSNLTTYNSSTQKWTYPEFNEDVLMVNWDIRYSVKDHFVFASGGYTIYKYFFREENNSTKIFESEKEINHFSLMHNRDRLVIADKSGISFTKMDFNGKAISKISSKKSL